MLGNTKDHLAEVDPSYWVQFVQLRSFHMVVRLCSKSFKLGFRVCELRNSRCTSWVCIRQRNQRSNCQHSMNHGESKGIPKNIYFCFIDYTKVFVWITTNWKILKEMGIPDHLTCLLRNLYAGQEPTVRTEHGLTDWFKTGKGVPQSCILSPCLFNLYAEYIMQNAGLSESQAGIRLLG